MEAAHQVIHLHFNKSDLKCPHSLNVLNRA